MIQNLEVCFYSVDLLKFAYRVLVCNKSNNNTASNSESRYILGSYYSKISKMDEHIIVLSVSLFVEVHDLLKCHSDSSFLYIIIFLL